MTRCILRHKCVSSNSGHTHSRFCSAAERLGLDLPITKLLHNLFDAMVQSGKGDMDHSGLLTHLEALNNITVN